MFKKSGEKGHTCFVHDLTEKLSRYLPLNMMLAKGLFGFFVDIFNKVEDIPLYT
jgi:hypothetical protein